MVRDRRVPHLSGGGVEAAPGRCPARAAAGHGRRQAGDFPHLPLSGERLHDGPSAADGPGSWLYLDYDGSSGTAVCARGTDTISVRAASTQATVNGKTTNWLAVPAELRGGIFCVPVRFFAEAAGADVTWDAAGQTFYLTTAIQEG